MYLAHFNDGFHMSGYDWTWGLLMMLFWALVVIAIVVLLVRGMVGGMNGRKSHGDDSLEIAKERYAKGEISKKEFDQLKRDLVSK